MRKEQKQAYEDTEVLRQVFKNLVNRKFRLDCGHHVTFGHWLGNDVAVRNGKDPKITCLECCY